jgi:hypothetical protein
MKSISMFIMIFISMVSFTSTATTAKMEQKRKTEFVKGISLVANAVSVVNEINVVSVIADATIKKEFKVKSFETIQPITSEATNDDVGWQSRKIYFITFYKEKLHSGITLVDPYIRNSRNNC